MTLKISLIVARKELKVLRRKKSIISYTVGLPILLSIGFSFIIKSQIAGPGGVPSDYQLGFDSLLYFFVVVAAILPTSIAAYSIVGEKIEKSLEPLLATPATDGEILLGKSIAAFVPILAVWLGASIFMIVSDYLTRGPLGFYYFPNWTAAVMLLLLAPLASIFGIELAVIASSRVSDVRGANQIGGLMFVPFMGIFLAGVEGIFTFDALSLFVVSLIVFIIDVLLFVLSRRAFSREEILTKWK